MYNDKRYTNRTAITNARLARILTADDYDFTKKEPILWTPSPNYRVNVGTRSKVKAT